MATTEKEKPSAGKAEAAGAEAKKSGGGIKPLLPVILVVVLMPALAYATTTFLVIPKIKKAAGASDSASAHGGESAAGDGHGEDAKGEGGHGGAKKGPGGKTSLPFGKVLVNVSGSLGTRYLLTSLTFTGTDPQFKDKIEAHRDQLLDLASSALSTKTIQELEKPGSRNLIRSEMLSVFNTALGGNLIQEIFFTEFAIQ